MPVSPVADLEPGRIHGRMLSPGQYAGALVLESDLSDGILEAGVE